MPLTGRGDAAMPRRRVSRKYPSGGRTVRGHDLLKLRLLGRVAVFLFALPVFVLISAASAGAQGFAPVPAPPAASPPNEVLHNWRRGMTQVPVPRPGCFTANYPNTRWQEVPCVTPPAVPFPPARGPQPDTIGNGHDASAEVTGLISTAVGSFDSVTGVTSESGPNGANEFSLQLNSSFFITSTCSGAQNPPLCKGWQQFVLSSFQANAAYMQYWLLT
jgi:hypothetical protein